MPLPKPSVRRYKDFKLIYDLNFVNRTIVVRQRIYKNENNTIQTPITSLTLAREYKGNEKIPAVREFNSRYLRTCFINPETIEGVTELKAIIPYKPTDNNFKNHIKEILNYNGVASGFYFSEEHTSDVKKYFI